MSTSPTSEPTPDRDNYLKKWFPIPVSWDHHAPGRFAEVVLESLMVANPIEVVLRRTGTRFVAIDALELGGTPTHEEVHLRFRLVDDPKDVPNPEDLHWGDLDEPIKGSLDPVCFYSLAAEVAPERALDELRAFVAEHLDDELVSPPVAEAPAVRPGTLTSTTVWVVALMVFCAGIVGLIALALVEAILHRAYELALGLGSAALIAGGAGIAASLRAIPLN